MLTDNADDNDNNNDTRWTEHDCIGSLPNAILPQPMFVCAHVQKNHASHFLEVLKQNNIFLLFSSYLNLKVTNGRFQLAYLTD